MTVPSRQPVVRKKSFGDALGPTRANGCLLATLNGHSAAEDARLESDAKLTVVAGLGHPCRAGSDPAGLLNLRRPGAAHANADRCDGLILACRPWLWHARSMQLDTEALAISLPIEALEAEVLRLPTVERARLLDRIVASLDADKVRDEAWDQLAASRDAEIESGAAKPVSGPEVIAKLRAELL